MNETTASNDKTGSGLTRVMGAYIDSSISWEDLAWMRRFWKGKAVLKGVRTVEDVKRAGGWCSLEARWLRQGYHQIPTWAAATTAGSHKNANSS
jgi:isopentenyl diphosphate isomerase/L-lactate dehydrogenase-like FMN-dependent dehydrogenase